MTNVELILATFRASWSFDIDAETVIEFSRSGRVPESTIGEEYDEALTDALQDTFDALGISVGA